MSYCATTEVRAAGTQITSTGSAPPATDELLDQLIERASRFFDLECGVIPGYFDSANAAVSNKTFYGDGSNFMRLDPYVPGSLNTTVTVPAGYSVPTFIESGSPPDQYLILSSDGVMLGRVSPLIYGGWYLGVPIIISARWGFEETPADVKLAVIELVINLLRETDPASLKLISIDNQPLREVMPPRVKQIARKYRSKMGVFV